MNVRSLSRRFPAAVVGALALVLLLPVAAFAKTWVTVDTDNIERSSPSQGAYTTAGSFTWQREKLGPSLQYEDYQSKFSVKLNLDGVKKSCARLKIQTYYYHPKTFGGTDTVKSKRFPADGSANFGYYTYCSATGKGSKVYTGTDFLNVGFGNTDDHFGKADISICYSKSTGIPPGGDCYNFTINAGDPS